MGATLDRPIKLEMLYHEKCSIAQEGERGSPAQQQGSQLIGCHFLVTTLVDKHAHITVKCLPNCQELVHISVHKCIPLVLVQQEFEEMYCS